MEGLFTVFSVPVMGADLFCKYFYGNIPLPPIGSLVFATEDLKDIFITEDGLYAFITE